MKSYIEVNHLKYFYFTVLEGGVAPAAKRLCVQQPVVSKMLKNLEDNLGQPLFWKKGRSKSLTDYGQLIYRHCQVIFHEVNKIQQVTQDPEKLTGVFNVGGAEPIVNHFLPDIFSQLIHEFPQMNLNVYTSTQKNLLEMISGGHLELGCFFYIPTIPGDLEIFQKIPMKFRLVIKKSEKNKKDIIQRFIGSREIDDTSAYHFPTVELMRKKYPETRITFSTNSISLHKKLVLKGQGVSIMPEFLVAKELSRGTLVDVLPKEKFQWDLLLVKRKADGLSLVGERFLHENLQRLPGQ